MSTRVNAAGQVVEFNEKTQRWEPAKDSEKASVAPENPVVSPRVEVEDHESSEVEETEKKKK